MVIFPQLIIQKYLTHWEFHFLVYTLFHLLHLYRNRLSAYLKVWQPFRLVTLYLGNGLHSFYGQNCGIGWNSGQEVACKIRLMWRVCLKRQKTISFFLIFTSKKADLTCQNKHAKIIMSNQIDGIIQRLPFFTFLPFSMRQITLFHFVYFVI